MIIQGYRLESEIAAIAQPLMSTLEQHALSTAKGLRNDSLENIPKMNFGDKKRPEC